jgi:hypothetical protein
MRIACGFLIMLVYVIPVISQTASPAPPPQEPSLDASAWSRFFSEAAVLRTPTESVYLNGQITRLRHPTLQEAIGLTDKEAEYLKNVAFICETNLRTVERSARAAILTARLYSLDDQIGERDALAQLAELSRRRNEVIRSSVEILKVELGSIRFHVLERFISDRLSQPNFFPPHAQ